jgi:hypothetical protein
MLFGVELKNADLLEEVAAPTTAEAAATLPDSTATGDVRSMPRSVFWLATMLATGLRWDASPAAAIGPPPCEGVIHW